MKLYRIRYVSVILFGLILLGCEPSNETDNKQSRVSELPFYDQADFTPHWFEKSSDSLADFHAIKDFDLLDQNGNRFTNEDLKGKIYVADFFFTTCPGICPKMTDNMGDLQEEFLNDTNVFLISHSVTPERDTVEILKKYAINKGVNETTWRLLTGDRALIYDLGRNYYFVEEDLGVEKTLNDFLHTENFVLIDPQGHIRGIYNGLNKTAIQQLIADIETLKEELDTIN